MSIYELLREGHLTQLVLVIGLLIIMGLLLGTAQAIPDVLSNAFLLIVGFFFGNRKTDQVINLAERTMRQNE